MLVTTWLDNPHRPTRDIDFLGFGDPSPETMLNTFREVCAVLVEDGIEFDAAALRVDQIGEELEYGGLRLRTTATVGGARANIVIDVGFGDAIEPGIEETELPVLLELPAPRLKAYARETVIAEKFQAMVFLGRANREGRSRREAGCIFCEINEDHILMGNDLALAIRDAYPVTALHSLVIPRRHTASYFDLYEPERRAVSLLLEEVKARVEEADRSVSGFNVGINSGEDAGQTVLHCHVHLIPTRSGDVENPRGGVRGAIPGRASY